MISMEQVITVVRAGGTGKLIDTAIVPLTVLTLVIVFNRVLDVTQYEDPSDDTSFVSNRMYRRVHYFSISNFPVPVIMEGR